MKCYGAVRCYIAPSPTLHNDDKEYNLQDLKNEYAYYIMCCYFCLLILLWSDLSVK